MNWLSFGRIMDRLPLFAASSAAALLLVGTAFAQGVMPVQPMPMPPSVRDAPPKTDTAPAKKKPARKPTAATESGASAASGTNRSRASATPTFRSTQEGRMSDQIDTRRSRPGGGVELEDDPRTVTPMIQNGRAGMGMRF